jgi:hypothetical protein
MTLPDERYRSIQQAKQLLLELTDPRLTPRIPAGIRDRARGALRHYPSDWDLRQLESAAPQVIQQHMEPLHRMVAAWDPEVVQPHTDKDR